MSEEQIEDLKRYIDSILNGLEVRITTKIDSLDRKLKADYISTGEAIEELNDQPLTEDQLK